MKYIYALIDPRTRGIRYVGQSGDPESRFKQHIGTTENTPKGVWIRELRSLNLEPDLIILGEAEDQQQVNHLEIWWMLVGWRQGWQLTNGTSPSELQVAEDFKMLFASELVRTSAEGVREAVSMARMRMLNHVVSIVATPFVLLGTIYIGLSALESPGLEYGFMVLSLMVMWLLTLPVLYGLGFCNVLTEHSDDAYNTWVARFAYVGLAASVIVFGFLGAVELFVKWGWVAI